MHEIVDRSEVDTHGEAVCIQLCDGGEVVRGSHKHHRLPTRLRHS